MKAKVIILLLIASTAHALTLQEMADEWGTKYFLADLAKFGAEYKVGEPYEYHHRRTTTTTRVELWDRFKKMWLMDSETTVTKKVTNYSYLNFYPNDIRTPPVPPPSNKALMAQLMALVNDPNGRPK